MNELWIKKTIYRRYLITNAELEEVIATIEHEADRAEELIQDIYDKNKEIEYDNEEIIIPIEYSIRKI
jgi:hypothetical protein